MRVLVNVLAIIMRNYNMQIDGRNVASSLNHLLDVAVQADLATEICIRISGYKVPILTS